MLPETIKIYHPETGEPTKVETSKYVKRKCGDLKNFGYANLTEETVSEQLQYILEDKPLSVIGMLMEKDICD